MPISLSTAELEIIMQHAAPIPIVDRGRFLRSVADRLAEFSGALGRETLW